MFVGDSRGHVSWLSDNVMLCFDFRRSVLILLESVIQVAAAGPFTTNDNLAYEPLVELFAYAKKVRPNLLILVVFWHFFYFPHLSNSDSQVLILQLLFVRGKLIFLVVVFNVDGSVCRFWASTDQAGDCRQVILPYLSGRDQDAGKLIKRCVKWSTNLDRSHSVLVSPKLQFFVLAKSRTSTSTSYIKDVPFVV